MYDILDTYADHRDENLVLKPDWFWTKGPIPNLCLQQLIRQYNVGSAENGVYSGWTPLDVWVWTPKITMFFGSWTLNTEEGLSSDIRTWYLSVAGLEHDMCPAMMSESFNDNFGIAEIKRGYSPLKWMFLNDKDRVKYLYERMRARVSPVDFLYNGLTVDLYAENSLLSYVLKEWWPDIEQVELPPNLLGE